MVRALWCGVFALSLPGVAIAQPLVGGWIADPSTGCRVWDPYPKADESVKWDGACANGFLQGKGVLRWYVKGQLTETVSATYYAGKMSGHVVLTGSNYSFEGELQNQVPNGFGTLKFDSGQVYSGQWVNGCFNDGSRRFAYMVTTASCGIP